MFRREAFQTSPQPLHRQYVCSSGFRAVVVIEDDWHDGHAVGSVRALVGRGRSPKRFHESYDAAMCLSRSVMVEHSRIGMIGSTLQT